MAVLNKKQQICRNHCMETVLKNTKHICNKIRSNRIAYGNRSLDFEKMYGRKHSRRTIL